MRGERSETLHRFLTGRGYKYEAPNNADPDHVVAKFYRVAYGTGVPDCLCNYKPPQFVITESSFGIDDDMPPTTRMGFRNEAPQGWIDFSFYSVFEQDLVRKIDEMEAALLAAWTTLFNKPEVTR